MIAKVLKFLGSGTLDRIFDTLDAKISAETDREKIKGDILREYYRNRSDWMRSGGFVLCLIFAVPLAIWFGAVILYSILWCQGCVFPQGWTIAALPAPLDEWAGVIILSLFGVVGVSRFK